MVISLKVAKGAMIVIKGQKSSKNIYKLLGSIVVAILDADAGGVNLGGQTFCLFVYLSFSLFICLFCLFFKIFFFFFAMLLIGHDLHHNCGLCVIGVFNLVEHCISLEIPVFNLCVGLKRLHLFD
jgi:hypothetical protein